MEHDFWYKKWADGKIGFHQPDINPYLQAYWQQLQLTGNEKVFVPLCGKSKDMLWLRDRGHEVVGVELSQAACEAFFQESDQAVTVTQKNEFTAYSSLGFELLCGDFFNLSAQDLAGVRVVYDRASLIALPEAMRLDYVSRLLQILPPRVQIFLVTLEFAEDKGPPFSVVGEEVVSLFAEHFSLECVARAQPEALRDKGRDELVWLLQSKHGE